MNTTKWRKDGRFVVDNPEINSAENFATETLLKKQTSQTPVEQKTVSIQITQTEPTRTAEVFAERAPQQQPIPNLPSEIVRVCIDGRQAEMRVYGGIIRFLD